MSCGRPDWDHGTRVSGTPLWPASDAPPTITVQVSNYSQASPAILAAAEREAGRILGQAGLRASWLECSVAPSTLAPKDPCQKAPAGYRHQAAHSSCTGSGQVPGHCLRICHPSGSRQCVLRVCVASRPEGRCRVRSSRSFWVASWPTNSAICCWARTATPTGESCSRGGKRIRSGS